MANQETITATTAGKPTPAAFRLDARDLADEIMRIVAAEDRIEGLQFENRDGDVPRGLNLDNCHSALVQRRERLTKAADLAEATCAVGAMVQLGILLSAMDDFVNPFVCAGDRDERLAPDPKAVGDFERRMLTLAHSVFRYLAATNPDAAEHPAVRFFLGTEPGRLREAFALADA